MGAAFILFSDAVSGDEDLGRRFTSQTSVARGMRKHGANCLAHSTDDGVRLTMRGQSGRSRGRWGCVSSGVFVAEWLPLVCLARQSRGDMLLERDVSGGGVAGRVGLTRCIFVPLGRRGPVQGKSDAPWHAVDWGGCAAGRNRDVVW